MSFETVSIKESVGDARAYLGGVTQECHGRSEAPAFSVQHMAFLEPAFDLKSMTAAIRSFVV